MMKTSLIILSLTFLLSGTAGVSAEPDGPAPELLIPLYLKIITYDRTFDHGQFDTVRILIVYDRSIPESYAQLLAMQSYFQENSALAVGGAHIRHESLALEQIDSIRAPGAEYTILLVTQIGAEKIENLIQSIRAPGVHSFSLTPEYVSLGLAVGLKAEAKSQAILINLKAAHREGSQYSAHLLKMCEIR